uniref:DUF547 domain-containing protein n=1 Tax=Timema shepardi TaxID=629360 RepID=A0A7R9AUM1_TIMSH|nr:unnamed protein product [Timema shepardi]
MERLCSRLAGESCTEELFYRVVCMKRHWVEDLVSWCSEIVICGKLEIVQTLLSGPGLSVLWPVVLLHTYNQFANREQIFDSLNFLITQCKLSMALQDVTVALEREITLVQWCKRNNPSLTLDNRHLLELAKRHSTLETLRQTCNLATLPWTDVRSLLDTQGGSVPDSTTSNWDVVTFDGFCILMIGFNIILSASEIENLSKKLLRSREWPPKCNELINLMNPIISARFTHIDPAVNEQSTQDMSKEDKGFSPTQKMYSEQVTKKLQTMKEMICKLFPLTYRIEVMENLFSLLFLRHEHFHSDSSSDSGGENEEADTVRKSLEVSPQDSNSTQPKTSNQDSLVTMGHLKNFEDLNVFFPLNEIPLIKSLVPCSVPISDINIMASSTCQKVADTKSDTRLASQPSASEMSYPSSENMSSLSSSFLSSAMFISMNPSTELRGGVQEEIPTRNSLRDQPNTLLDSKRRPRRVRRTRVRNSSGVSDSSVSSFNDGFVCNKYVVRDLLHCLKECLVNSSVAFYNCRSQQDYADQMTHVPSSVSLDTLQHRMNRLSQYASEASWRLQLLTDPHFIGEVGQVPEWGLLPETEQSPWIHLSESTASDSDDESPRDTMPCNKRAPRRRGQSDTDKSSSSSTRSISGGTTAAPKRKGSQSRSQRVSLPSTRHNIINLMLSSHTNLAIRCLTHGDYIKAKDAIKKFDEEDNPLVAEVKFTEASLSLRKRLQACIGIDEKLGEAKLTLGPSQCKTSTENSIFKSLRQVAAEGVQTTSLSSLVETFLSVTPLQTIPVTDTECRLSGSLLECADNSQAITALDLAFTFGTTFQHSASLLDVACRHCDRLQGDSKKSLGFVGFSRNMIHLLKEANMESDEPRGELPSNISVSRLLGCSYLPLSVKQLREHKQFWKELDDSLRQFQLALEQSEGAAHSPSRSTRMNEFHEAKPHVAFKRLLRVFANNVLYKDSDGPSYLYYLYIYLKSLSSLLVQFLPETDKQIPRTYFDILGESVVSIIGRLVFDHDVPPSQLEGVTSKLKLDLVQLVIQNCCPVIPDTPPPLPFQGAASNEWGRILLNKAGMEKNGEARHPELCVRTLLSDLLTLIKDNLESSSGVLTVECATRLANDSSVQALLASTSEIVAVDLTLLSPGVETLAFLANLTNLMWIHALLTLETSPREVEGSSSDNNFGLISKSAMCRLMSMQCVGYTVGALGFVSLFELLNTLLGPDLAISLPSLLRSVAQHGRSTHHEDLWDRFTVSSDPRFLFALTNGHKYSPKVQVLHANNMDEQLDRCMVEYVNHFIAVEVMESGTRLLIPPLIQSYHEFVLVNQEPESHTMMPDLLDREDSSSISRREKFSLLLEFLRDNSSGEQRSRLYDSVHSLTSSNMVVSLKSSYVFSITLEYTNGNGVEISAAEALLEDTEEDMWDKRVLQEPVVKFLEQHCWLLAVLVKKIHQDKSLHASPVQECSPSSSLDRRTWCLEQLCCAPWVKHLQPMFGGNATLAALHTTPPTHLLWAWFEQLASDNKWQCCADTLWALPEALLLQDTRLQMFNDTVMAELAATIPNSECPTPWWYCQHIGDICTQAKCILANMFRWPVEECIFALRVLMESECRKLPEALETQVHEHLHKMLVYKKVPNHAQICIY